jgi:hypothetical protein
MTQDELKARRTELEGELQKAQQNVADMMATAHRIEGAITLLTELIVPDKEQVTNG